MIKVSDKNGDFLIQTLRTLSNEAARTELKVQAQQAISMLNISKLATENPRYQHDCMGCTFLGRFVCQDEEVDLYHCYQLADHPTVIARYGDEGAQYTSGRRIPDPRLKEASRRASLLGLVI